MPTIEDATAKPVEKESTTTEAPRFLPLETIPIRLEGPSISSKNLVFGLISNMSKSGACVITNRSLPKDTMVRVTIAGGRAKHMNVAARVIWCAERVEPVKEIVGYLTGLTFEADCDDAVHDLLSSGIFQPVP